MRLLMLFAFGLLVDGFDRARECGRDGPDDGFRAGRFEVPVPV